MKKNNTVYNKDHSRLNKNYKIRSLICSIGKVRYLRFFNIVAIFVILIFILLELQILFNALNEKNTDAKGEMFFAIAMLAFLSLWIVIPSFFTGIKLIKTYKIESYLLIAICSIQVAIIIILELFY